MTSHTTRVFHLVRSVALYINHFILKFDLLHVTPCFSVIVLRAINHDDNDLFFILISSNLQLSLINIQFGKHLKPQILKWFTE